MKRIAIRNKDGLYLSKRPSWGKRSWVKIADAALWIHRGHATLAAKAMDPKFRSWYSASNQGMEHVEFNMFLVEASVGTLTATDLKEQS